MTLWAVTGGTGLVGRFVVEACLAQGAEVAVLGRTPPQPGAFSRPVAFRPLDLDRAGDADLSGCTTLVHAAFDHVPGRYRGGEGGDPDGFRRRNVDGSRALFARARAQGVAAAVFLSSRAVYGAYPPGTLLTETLPPRPDTLYGATKLEAEQGLAALVTPDFAGASLRATGVYGPPGPGQTHKWAGLFAAHLAGQPQPARIATELHGADLATAVRLVAGQSGVWNASDILLDQRDLLALVNARTGRDLVLPPPGDPAQVSAMDCAALQALGWRPGGRAALEAAIPALLAATP